MDFSSAISHVAALFALTVLINLPFGYFRKRTRRFSLQWFLCVHIPIPFIFLARVLSHLDFRYIPLFVAAAVIGQIWGARMEF
jgi:ABC-type dipeptide/oligopeptide/nickel transport system permease subunit